MVTKKKTSFKKGKELEEKFAQYMKDELGYNKTRTRAHLPGKDNVKGYEADIIAQKDDEIKEYLDYGTKFLLVIGSIVMIIGLGELLEESINQLCKENFIYILIAGIALYVIDYLRKWEWAWVECKNLRGGADIDQVSKLLRQFKDYNNVESGEYNITKLIFVSTNGFKENAIKHAETNDVECYEINEKGEFIESTYWS